jgi:hypothetical protein
MQIHRAFNKSYIYKDSFIKLSHEERLNDEINFYKRIQNFDQNKLFAKFKADLSNGLTYALELHNYQDCVNLAQYMLGSFHDSSTRNYILLDKTKILYL